MHADLVLDAVAVLARFGIGAHDAGEAAEEVARGEHADDVPAEGHLEVALHHQEVGIGGVTLMHDVLAHGEVPRHHGPADVVHRLPVHRAQDAADGGAAERDSGGLAQGHWEGLEHLLVRLEVALRLRPHREEVRAQPLLRAGLQPPPLQPAVQRGRLDAEVRAALVALPEGVQHHRDASGVVAEEDHPHEHHEHRRRLLRRVGGRDVAVPHRGQRGGRPVHGRQVLPPRAGIYETAVFKPVIVITPAKLLGDPEPDAPEDVHEHDEVVEDFDEIEGDGRDLAAEGDLEKPLDPEGGREHGLGQLQDPQGLDPAEGLHHCPARHPPHAEGHEVDEEGDGRDGVDVEAVKLALDVDLRNLHRVAHELVPPLVHYDHRGPEVDKDVHQEHEAHDELRDGEPVSLSDGQGPRDAKGHQEGHVGHHDHKHCYGPPQAVVVEGVQEQCLVVLWQGGQWPDVAT
mmetsp:Transcript_62471/g.197922  ORF Transcript_62471/g.197922 Transcript_62471/m.197922 type:complete len:458 (-) Transcript_62471:942-2315(-)